MSPRALLVAGGLLTASCASGPGPHPVPTAASSAAPCLVAADSAGPTRAIGAAFDDSADARRARRAAALDAPLRLDCEGRPSPGLAVAWSADTTGQFWTLVLRAVEPTDTGRRWTAAALAATWRADPDAATALGSAGVASLLPLDERRLVVEFSTAQSGLPALFADPALGVASRTPRPGLEPVAGATTDLRDAVDGRADLVHTSDPDLLDYARRRPGLTIVPLPWSRSYLLLLPPRSAGVGSAIPADTAAFRAGLARDAVRAEARPAAPPFWWEAAAACPRPTSAPPTPRPLTNPGANASANASANAIAYPAGDAVARGLAERVVALSGAPGLTVRGLRPDSLAPALGLGSERAYVIAAPRHALIPCRESAAWPAHATVIPLVETRPSAVIRRGAPPLVVEWDGTLRLADTP